MLSKKIEQALNNQVAMEAYASAYYLSIASWCDTQGMEGCATFFYEQTDEERVHMLKLVHYINQSDGRAIAPGVETPPTEFKDIKVVFEKTLAHELKVTKAINDLVDLCYQEKDHTTLNFLQWYVSEQHEEEVTVKEILDKIKLIGLQGTGLYFIDQEVAKLNKGTSLMSEASTPNV